MCWTGSRTPGSKQRTDIEEASEQIVPRLQGAAALEAPDAELSPDALEQSVAALAAVVRRRARRVGRRAEVPGFERDRVPAGARRAGDAAADAAPDGRGRHLRPDRRRVRALLGGRALARPALREDALRQRAPGARVPARVPGVRATGCSGGCARRRSTGRCASCARTRVGLPRLWTPTPRASRGSSTSGRRRRFVAALGEELGAVARGAFRSHRGRELRRAQHSRAGDVGPAADP